MSQAETLAQHERFEDAAAKATAALAQVQSEKGRDTEEALGVMDRLSWFYHESGQWAALDRLARSIRRLPLNGFDELRQQGRILALDEDFPGAEKSLRSAARLRPQDGSILADLGRLYEAEGRYADAAAAFRRTLLDDPKSTWVWLSLAHAYQMIGRYNEALMAYARAKKANPKEEDIYIAEGYAKLAHGNSAGTQKDFEKVSRLPNGYLSAHHLGSLANSLGQTDKAISLYEDAIKRNIGAAIHKDRSRDDLRHSFLNLGDLYSQQGRRALVEAAFRKARRLCVMGDPRWFQASAHLVSFYEDMGRWAAAEEICSQSEDFCRANNGHPRSPCFGASALHALLAIKEGRRAAAEKFYGEALRWRPSAVEGSPGVYMFYSDTLDLAEAAAALGHRRQSERLLKSVSAIKRAARADYHLHYTILEALRRLAKLYDEDGRKKAAGRLRREADKIEGKASNK
jgi:tetratricopeptide (TPR) repeat protein